MSKTSVFLLFGGIMSTDGIFTSAGMNIVANMLRKLPSVSVKTYLWANWSQVYQDIQRTTRADKIVVIGYSGGGMKATWVANGCVVSGGRIVYEMPTRIDLMITYDPSPNASMQALGKNVLKAINYHNNAPWMFGLGGGVLHGPNIETVEISEQHLAVQYDMKLHNRTVDEVKKLSHGNS